MRIAHARERHAAAGTPYRLVAARGGSAPAAHPESWLDLETARRRAIAANPNRAHDSSIHRQPVTTLDDHLGRGLRIAVLEELLDSFAPRGDGAEDDEAVLDPADLVFGPPILRPPSLRDFYAFEGHVRTM